MEIPQFESTYEVRAWGEDEQEVRDVVEPVVAAAPDITDELQVRANVPPPQRYQPFVLAPTQVEMLPSTGWVKLVIAVMGVGLLMGAAWSVVVDRILRQLERRRAASRAGSREKRKHKTGSPPKRRSRGATSELVVQEPAQAEPRPRPDREPVTAPVGGLPRGPTKAGPAESLKTPNGQRLPKASGTGPAEFGKAPNGQRLPKASGTGPPEFGKAPNGK